MVTESSCVAPLQQSIPLVQRNREWITPIQNKSPKTIHFDSTMKKQVTTEIETMLGKGAIKQTHQVEGQFLSNIFLRKKKGGTFRPVVNLRKWNSHIPYQKFKMETLKDVKDTLKEGDFMVKLDLKDAYFSIPIHQNSNFNA